jgi:hypothetical protein
VRRFVASIFRRRALHDRRVGRRSFFLFEEEGKYESPFWRPNNFFTRNSAPPVGVAVLEREGWDLW